MPQRRRRRSAGFSRSRSASWCDERGSSPPSEASLYTREALYSPPQFGGPRMTRSSVALVLLVVARSASAAAAESPPALDKMVEMNHNALDELRLGKNQAARDELLHALTVGKEAGLSTHQMMARTHLHLGAVYLTGFGDRDKAMRELVAAVEIRPGIQITPQLLTPSLQEAFEAAPAEG